MDFLNYHLQSSKIRDIDPANDCLRYISDRFELTMEQRYWIAFLYSTCYCAPTVFYMYNEFPDFENVNVGRLQRWWDANKSKTIFQTDRLKIKTMNKLVETFESYRAFIGGGTQAERFHRMAAGNPVQNYNRAYEEVAQVRNIGRFTLFIYLEMLNVLTDYKCLPSNLDWKYAAACREGMVQALGAKRAYSNEELDVALAGYVSQLELIGCEHSNVFNVETTLCAYKKYKQGRRYVGYYIDRQLEEINKIKGLVRTGVAWRVLDEFREETYKHLKHDKLSTNRDLWHRENLGVQTINF